MAGTPVAFVKTTDGVKMSEVLQAFLAPYMKFVKTEEHMQKLLTIAVAAWNISLLPKDERMKAVDNIITSLPPDAQADAKSIVMELMQRKKKYFGKIRRAVLDFEVSDVQSGFHLTVISTAEDIEVTGTATRDSGNSV